MSNDLAEVQKESGPTAPPRTTASGGEPPKIVRLSINLAPTVAAALKMLTERRGVTVTEGIRRAIALWKLVEDEQEKGNKIFVVEGEGDNAKYRELVMI